MPAPHPAPTAPLLAALAIFDEEVLVEGLDSSRAHLPLDAWFDEVLLPFLQAVGDAWEAGELSVAHEHFAAQLVRRHLAAITPAGRSDDAPLALLACPAGERHELALQAFGILLAGAGWRVRFLGQDTPMPALTVACRILEPSLVVVAATRRTALEAHSAALRRLSARHRVVLAGRGADPHAAAGIGAEVLPSRMVEALAAITGGTPALDAEAPTPPGDGHGGEEPAAPAR